MAVSGVAAVILAAGGYLAGVKHLHWAVIEPVLQPRIVRAYLVDPRLRQLIQLMNDEYEDRRDAFSVFWNARHTELISKRLFRPVEMYGVQRYMYRPGVNTLQFTTGAAGVYRSMEMEDSPELRRVLAGLDTTRLAKASYDRLGFRHVDADLTRDCAVRVLFLGDSFTDGVGVDDSQTFASLFGHLVRERMHVQACPINAGVEGYSSLEESYILETFYDELERPPLIVLMHYVNDVDDDEGAVLGGTIPETDPRWKTTLSYLARIDTFARLAGARLIVAAIPSSRQFDSPQSRVNYQEVLKRFCLRSGVPFVDLYDAIDRSGWRAAYFEDDPHWSPAGHRVVAEALLDAARDTIAR